LGRVAISAAHRAGRQAAAAEELGPIRRRLLRRPALRLAGRPRLPNPRAQREDRVRVHLHRAARRHFTPGRPQRPRAAAVASCCHHQPVQALAKFGSADAACGSRLTPIDSAGQFDGH
jgi:hypothetical protein